MEKIRLVEEIENIKTKLGVTDLTVVIDFEQLQVQIRNGEKVVFKRIGDF
ncbi:MAG: hypothetical protein PUP92_38460 [Rhizonema sp. PD38]|nr:hypothetical protein [Rhizonema sp. PD38]